MKYDRHSPPYNLQATKLGSRFKVIYVSLYNTGKLYLTAKVQLITGN